MDIVSRAAWGARPPTSTRTLRSPLGIAVHYSADDPFTDHGRCPRHVKAIQEFHQMARGWADIAYSFLVCQHGSIYEGRGWGTRTAAQGTAFGNDNFHAVCWMGGPIWTPSPAALSSIGAVVRAAPGHERRPHSWFKATQCPGDPLRAWLKGLNVSSDHRHQVPPDDLPRSWADGAWREWVDRSGTNPGSRTWEMYREDLAWVYQRAIKPLELENRRLWEAVNALRDQLRLGGSHDHNAILDQLANALGVAHGAAREAEDAKRRTTKLLADLKTKPIAEAINKS